MTMEEDEISGEFFTIISGLAREVLEKIQFVWGLFLWIGLWKYFEKRRRETGKTNPLRLLLAFDLSLISIITGDYSSISGRSENTSGEDSYNLDRDDPMESLKPNVPTFRDSYPGIYHQYDIYEE